MRNESSIPDWKWGQAFKDGKLYCFETRRILVAKPWPDLLAWVKTPTRTWRPTCKAADQIIMERLFPPGTLPELKTAEEIKNYVYPSNCTTLEQFNHAIVRRHEALASFFNEIPAEERLEVQRFEERRWYLLNLFARCPGGLELSQSNPALALALACNRAFHQPKVQRPYRSARSLLPKPQREILAWLGFPATDSVRRILSKIPHRSLTVANLLTLRKRLEEPAIQKLLAHLPVIHEGILRILSVPRYRPLATPAFLGDLARDSSVQNWNTLLIRPLWETFACFELLGEPFTLPRLRSMKAFLDYHQTVAARIGEAHVCRFPSQLPPPPFPGTQGIEPLTTSIELIREGAEMDHCIASHALLVHSGREAIYLVTEPIRATMSLENSVDGWRLGQVSGPRNSWIPAEVQADLFRRLTGSRQLAPI